MTKMKLKAALMIAAAAFSGAALATATETMISHRINPKSAANCVTGEWMSNFSVAKAYAEDNGLPFFAMWTNGDNCSHCVKFEKCANAKAFREWMAESGIVFWVGYNKDKSDDDREGGKGWKFAYNGQSLYPVIRLYWNAKAGTVLADGTVLKSDKVVINKYTMGDDLDGRYKPPDGTTKALKALKSYFKQYVPVAPTTYHGGTLAVPALPGVGLQAEVGLTTAVTIPLVRTNTTSRASAAANVVTVRNGSTTLLEQTVEWSAGQSEASVKVTMPAGMAAGDSYSIELTDDETGEVVDESTIEVVAAQENSTKNPYWLGERSAPGAKAAPELGWGEWTVDLDLAQAKAAKDGGFTLLLVGGGTWCPDCAAADHYFFEDARFKSWCEENKVALAVADIPNYNNASSKSSLLAYDVNDTMYNSRTGKYDNYRYVTYNYSGVTNLSERYQSGVGYLSRHNLTPDDAEVVALREKFRKLACDTTFDGGYKRPEATNTRMGVPILLALRADGSVAGRLTAFAVSGPTKFEEGYLTRLSEMIAQIDDAEEDANDHPLSAMETTPVSDRGTVSGARSISSTDMCDYYPVDASAVGPLVKFSVAGVSPDTDDVQITLSLCNQAKTTLETIATVTTNLGAGVELSAVVPTANCYLKVAYPVDAASKLAPPGTYFSTDKLKSTVCGYQLSTDCVLTPTETNQTFVVKDGVASVTMAVKEGETYRFGNVDDTDPSFVEHFTKAASDGLYIASYTESVTIPLADVETAFEYRVWNTGRISFAVPVAAVSEKDGKYVVEIVREGGSAGAAKATLRLNAEKTTKLDEIYSFEDDGRELVWNDGETDAKTATITVLNNEYYDGGRQIVALALEQTPGTSDAGLGGKMFELTIREDDTGNAGKLSLVGLNPGESKAGEIVARRGSDIELCVRRSGGTTDAVSGTVTASAGDLSATEFSWEGREGGDKPFTLTVPDASKVKLTLGGVAGMKVDSAHRYITVTTVAANAPQFVAEAADFSATRYVPVKGLSVGIDPAYLEAPGDVKVAKVSGSLPSGLKASLNAAGDALEISGTPTKAGAFSAVYQVTKGSVKGLTTTVNFSVSDPAVAASAGESALNPSVAATRIINDAFVLDNVTTALVGVASITIPRNGKVSAKIRFVDPDLGTKSFSSASWDSIDPADGTLTATLVNSKAGNLVISVDADGSVSLEGLDADLTVLIPEVDSKFTAARPADDWKGAYTVSMPLVDPADGVLARGAAFMCLKMTTASAVKKGTMTYAGVLPNGKSFSGTASLQPAEWDTTLATPNWGSAYMAFLLQSSTDGLGGVLEIVRADAVNYGIGLRRAVYAAEVDGAPVAVPRWMHRETATDEADYSAELGVFGGKYVASENWKKFYADYYKLSADYGDEMQTLSFFADPTVIDFSDDYGAALAWDAAGYGVTLGYTSKKENTFAKQSKGAAAGFSISFSSATGVVSGSFRAQTEEGYAVMKYRAVVLPGWGDSGCSDCAPGVQPAPERPFVSGSAWVKDTFVGSGESRPAKVVRGCEVSIGVEFGK